VVVTFSLDEKGSNKIKASELVMLKNARAGASYWVGQVIEIPAFAGMTLRGFCGGYLEVMPFNLLVCNTFRLTK
jgi:hypothetical protein